MLEQLGNADELVISYNPMTQLLMDNKNLFLSKRVIYSFGGFAGKLIQKSDTLDKDPIYHNSKKMHKTVMNAVRVYSHGLQKDGRHWCRDTWDCQRHWLFRKRKSY